MRIALICLVLLAGCGQAGDLYLPDPGPDSRPEVVPAVDPQDPKKEEPDQGERR